MPALSVLLDDLGRPHPTSLARLLDVDTRTVRRWLKADSAPRPVLLALFWLTRWGQSEIDAELTDRAALLARLADASRRELLQARHRLAELEARLSTRPGLAYSSRPPVNLPFERFILHALPAPSFSLDLAE